MLWMANKSMLRGCDVDLDDVRYMLAVEDGFRERAKREASGNKGDAVSSEGLSEMFPHAFGAAQSRG